MSGLSSRSVPAPGQAPLVAPNAMATTSDVGRCTIISNHHNSVITINIQAEGDKTKIQITNVSHKADTNSSSN